MLDKLFCIYALDSRQLSLNTKPSTVAVQRIGDDAVLDIVGLLSRDGRYEGGTSTDQVRSELKRLERDHSVKRIILRVNSSGGMSTGCTDLYDTVVQVTKSKPIIAVVEDCCCSAAYFIACGSTKIVANRSAICGSIGTYAILEDSSRMAESYGVEIHVVRAGSFKGIGEPGSKITPEHLADFQRVIDSINSDFISAVATSRKLTADKLQIVSEGRVWKTPDAIRYGLVDAIGDLDSVIAGPAAKKANSNDPSQPFAKFFERRKEYQMKHGSLPRTSW